MSYSTCRYHCHVQKHMQLGYDVSATPTSTLGKSFGMKLWVWVQYHAHWLCGQEIVLLATACQSLNKSETISLFVISMSFTPKALNYSNLPPKVSLLAATRLNLCACNDLMESFTSTPGKRIIGPYRDPSVKHWEKPSSCRLDCRNQWPGNAFYCVPIAWLSNHCTVTMKYTNYHRLALQIRIILYVTQKSKPTVNIVLVKCCTLSQETFFALTVSNNAIQSKSQHC